MVNNHIDEDIKRHAQYNDRIRETPNSQILFHQKTTLGDSYPPPRGGRRGSGRMVVGFTTIYAIGAYHH